MSLSSPLELLPPQTATPSSDATSGPVSRIAERLALTRSELRIIDLAAHASTRVDAPFDVSWPVLGVRGGALNAALQTHAAFDDADLVRVRGEGHAIAALQGARAWLRRRRPVLFIGPGSERTELADDAPATLVDFLHGLGYDRILIYDHRGALLCATRCSDALAVETLLEAYSGWASRRSLTVCAIHRSREPLFAALTRAEREHYRSERGFEVAAVPGIRDDARERGTVLEL